MNKSEQKKNNFKMDYSNMILIKPKMSCKKVPNMTNSNGLKNNNPNFSRRKSSDIKTKTRKN